MNLRQKKKLYKKKAGCNPPAWLKYTAPVYHSITGQAWGGLAQFKRNLENIERAKKKAEEIRNLENFTMIITRRNYERRKKYHWKPQDES